MSTTVTPATRSTTTSAAASANWRPFVRQGSHGPVVAELQQRLISAGFRPGPVDGAFGPMTRAAVMAYQRARGLTVDGLVGPQTWGSLLGSTPAPSRPPVPAPVTPTGLPSSGNAFIDSIAAGAMESQRRYGVPASVTIAQAILESGWGRSGLTRQGFNFFGIKGTGPAGTMRVLTHEFVGGHEITVYANFRKYHNAAESMEDHARLLATLPWYRNAMSQKNNPKAFANALTGIYATAPNYGQTLIRLMNQYNLYRYD